MLKELGLVFSCISLLSSGQPQRNYSHTENLNAETTVTYKYESNEVNSSDDLIDGNIYSFDFDDFYIELIQNQYSYLDVDLLSGDIAITLSFGDSDFDDYWLYGPIHFEFLYQNVHIYLGDVKFACVVEFEGVISTENVVFIYHDSQDIDYSYFHYTDYNVIEDVTYTPPTTFIGVINEFCENYIFSEIPLVNEISFTVGGQQISLMTYIVIFVGLVCGVGLLILFIMLLKWLFLLVAGGFRLRR